jgi:hypothetical protein
LQAGSQEASFADFDNPPAFGLIVVSVSGIPPGAGFPGKKELKFA